MLQIALCQCLFLDMNLVLFLAAGDRSIGILSSKRGKLCRVVCSCAQEDIGASRSHFVGNGARVRSLVTFQVKVCRKTMFVNYPCPWHFKVSLRVLTLHCY